MHPLLKPKGGASLNCIKIIVVIEANDYNDGSLCHSDFCGSDVSDDEGHDRTFRLPYFHGKGVWLSDEGN